MPCFQRSPRALALVAAAAVASQFVAPASAQSAGPTLDDALAAIAAYAPVAMAAQGTPGLSLAITDRTKTLRILTLGYADAATRAPVTPASRFAIGSITKSMTALALMQLYDAGTLSLGAPVRRYLPWFAIDSGGTPILVHELLSHTAGIPDDFSLENGYRYDVTALRAAKVSFEPGTAWSYSNDGFATAGAILAQLDRRAWSEALQARVFDPLGMSASSPVFTPDALQTAAVGYQWLDNDRPGAPRPALVASPPMDFVDPAGSVLSTPEDMAAYMRLYLNGGKTADGRQLISPAAFSLMTHADRLANGKPAGAASPELAEAPEFYRQYGFGLSIFDQNGDHLIGHTGGVSGYTACMQMNLTRGFGVIAMANLVEAPLHPCAIALYAMRVLRAQSAGEPLPSPPPAPDPAHVANAGDYAGTYAASDGTELIVAARGDRLTMMDGTAAIALYPRGNDEFWADDPRFFQFLIAFGRNPRKQVVELTYGSQWYPNQRYAGPRTFAHPASWDALVGRYENVFEGQPYVTRVIIVKDRLTLDGDAPLQPLKNGTFALGDSLVRFDAYAGSQPQRLSIDDARLYRIELP
ncbi:MAG TPA: serine hydrolase domain-containing protein [Candidatus Tumulicola sp.]|jgi:CubicO group peptidase (beta-lactamase class C family)